ncbi:hypothetical protein [Salmonella sp. s60093]|uniref:hypothetical protein n=1 Tax=Salmonella sp. s60093 TaxID=3159721 RepID=UPI00397F4776
MNVQLIEEHENGDATYMFDLTKDEANALLTFGILEAIKAGLREGERLTVEGKDIENLSDT